MNRLIIILWHKSVIHKLNFTICQIAVCELNIIINLKIKLLRQIYMNHYVLKKVILSYIIIIVLSPSQASCNDKNVKSVTVPFVLDHNRMLVEAEFQRKDGRRLKAILWVDTGNPDFFISESFAKNLGIKIKDPDSDQDILSPSNVRIGGKTINFDGVRSSVDPMDKWLFNTMHCDGNLPSTVLKKYHIIFDYPSRMITIAEPGILKPRGIPSPAIINHVNGIIQMDALVDGKYYCFAFDNGASFSYVPDDIIASLLEHHPDWPNSKGAAGCANIWGHWPGEEIWPMLRIPEFQWGELKIKNAVIVGLPSFFKGRTDIGTNYSRKTARPVNGIFGPNIFKGYRVEIDYSDNILYFEKGSESNSNEMDIVGLTLKPLNDGRYGVLGIVKKSGKPVIEGVQQGDILLETDGHKTTGATMGTVVDALRGKPGEKHIIILERNGKKFKIEATVEHLL
jgi:hypothetical protein